jgi:dihydrofolate reductase
MSENRAIGRDGGLPWHLPHEMAQFRAYTLGHAVIMGRRNFEAENKPLPHRRNLVLTRQADWQPPADCRDRVEVFRQLDDALAAVADDCEPYIIGGADIYALALPRVDRMVLTTVHADLPGDTFFPEFDPANFTLVDARHHPADARHPHAFTVRTLDRIP